MWTSVSPWLLAAAETPTDGDPWLGVVREIQVGPYTLNHDAMTFVVRRSVIHHPPHCASSPSEMPGSVNRNETKRNETTQL
jgi:hypothetical protein